MLVFKPVLPILPVSPHGTDLAAYPFTLSSTRSSPPPPPFLFVPLIRPLIVSFSEYKLVLSYVLCERT